ncbi:MAG TPA: porin family protein [Xanthobacteraceae bacterium]|nr:porin family protein [Xanthobacteraceae bacterium]
MLRKLVMGVAGAIALCGVAAAADLPVNKPIYKAVPAPVFNWTGFYVGGTVGYGWGDNRHFNTFVGVGSQNFDIDGFTGGLTLGVNWQAPGTRWVLGLEFDISLSGIKGVLPVAPGFGCAGGCTTDVKWFGTFRGRAGYAFDRALIYVTGGLAFGEVEGSIIGAFPAGSETVTGWTAGVGGEFAIAPRWSMKLEYLYVDLGDATYASLFNLIVRDLDFHVVRAGLNYRF